MSDQFNELFQEIIRDHFKHPTHRAILNPNAPIFENPSCGDQVKLQIITHEDKIESCKFDGAGCFISMASTNMMCSLLENKSKDEAERLIDEFLSVMRGELPPTVLGKYGDLEALSGIAKLPVRVKCATLAWNAAKSILKNF